MERIYTALQRTVQKVSLKEHSTISDLTLGPGVSQSSVASENEISNSVLNDTDYETLTA